MTESTSTEVTRNIARLLMDIFAAKDAEGLVSLWNEARQLGVFPPTGSVAERVV